MNPPLNEFINSSNLSYQDAFLLSLHTQITDLQTELRLCRGHSCKTSRYYYVTFEYPLSIPEWNHWVAPDLLVGRTNPVGDLDTDADVKEPICRSKVFIILPQPCHLVFNASHKCLSVRPLDSFEFYKGIQYWIPGENDVWAWCRSFPGDPMDKTYQHALQQRWTESYLVSWLGGED